jgi:hypothetical protein
LVSDGRTSVVRQQLIVTTLSYISTIDRKRSWLTEGAELRKKTKLPWLVIHHHPPAFHRSAGPEELSAGELLEEFEPTFWAAGRFFDHAHPRGFTWMQRIDQSVVLNVTQMSIAPVFREAVFPNHIVFDLKSGKMQWRSWLESANEERTVNCHEPAVPVVDKPENLTPRR